MQSEAARRAGDPSHQSEDPPLRVLVITVRSPRPIRAVGSEARRRHVVQPDAVLEVAYGVLDLGVAAMIGLQFQRLPIAVGDEGVIAVSGEEGELGTGRRLHAADNEPHRPGVRLGLDRGVSRLGDIGGAVHPVGNGSPVLLWYRLYQVPQAGALADGDREADIHFPAGGNDSVGVEAAVGPHRELSPGPAVAHPPHRLTQEVGGATGGVGPALAEVLAKGPKRLLRTYLQTMLAYPDGCIRGKTVSTPPRGDMLVQVVPPLSEERALPQGECPSRLLKYGVCGLRVPFVYRVRAMGNVVWRFLFGLEQEDSSVFGTDDKQVSIYPITLELGKKFNIASLLLHYADGVRT